MTSAAGHETPEEKAASEDKFRNLAALTGRAGPTGQRIAETIRNRRKTTTQED